MKIFQYRLNTNLPFTLDFHKPSNMTACDRVHQIMLTTFPSNVSASLSKKEENGKQYLEFHIHSVIKHHNEFWRLLSKIASRLPKKEITSVSYREIDIPLGITLKESSNFDHANRLDLESLIKLKGSMVGKWRQKPIRKQINWDSRIPVR